MNKKLFIKHILFITIIVFNFASTSTFGQKIDFVKVIAGQGIIYNNDSIILFKTTINDLCKILNIKLTQDPNEFTIRMWDGYDPKTGEAVSGSDVNKEINYKSMNFQFSDSSSNKTLKLNWIQIKEDKTLKVYTDSGLQIGDINPKIAQKYLLYMNNDFISSDSLTYNLYTYGISFRLEKINKKDLTLTEISTHYITK
ncbi:MAG: hypothetical protein IPJ16_08745 [Bacteroidales bacterium]|nr:hypothetical protein [Bacteroidales bacterium]